MEGEDIYESNGNSSVSEEPKKLPWRDLVKKWIRKNLINKQAGVAGVTLLIFAVGLATLKSKRKRKLPAYSSATLAPLSLLLSSIDDEKLRSAVVSASNVFFLLNNTKNWNRVNLPDNPILQKQVFGALSKSKSSEITTVSETDYMTGILAALPFVYLGMVYQLMRKQFGGGTKKKTYSPTTTVTFRDVAGLEGVIAEIQEVVDYLRNPARYSITGAKAPRAILLHGPPGTGKTLLARAVAGEASAAFTAISASEFCEMYVGRGAARVRALFESTDQNSWLPQFLHTTTAKQKIVFIDELDALAKSRSTHATNDEREQTLNQLLTCMDGFDESSHVTVIAATNRCDVLDPAVLRRFDRQIYVGYPDEIGRQAILRVHAKNVSATRCMDLEYLSTGSVTEGFSGADLRNLVNEAALLAVRDNSSDVMQNHFVLAAQRIKNMKAASLGNTII